MSSNGGPLSSTAVSLFHVESLPSKTRESLMRQARQHGKAVFVSPVFDTIKLAEHGVVQATLDRDRLRWPVAWASRRELEPASDPPPPDWFEGAAVVEAKGS